jgi:Tfp pilus assembly protein PilP
MTTHLRLIALALAMSVASRAAAQSGAAQKPAAAPAAAPAVAQPAVPLPSPPANFVYAADGRRDPFVSLLKRGADPTNLQSKRAEGVAGLQTGEIAVRGIVQSRGAWAAMVAGPDGKVYTLRTGDHLSDGTVRSVTAQYVAVLQEVKDPLSVEKQREVRKYLRGGEEVK